MSDKPKSQIGFRPINDDLEPYIFRVAAELQKKYGQNVTKTDVINIYLEKGMVSGEMKEVCDNHFKKSFDREVVNA